MRLLFLLALLIAFGEWMLGRTPVCQRVGHDAHWSSCGNVRECRRCGTLWMRDLAFNAEIGVTTSSDWGRW